MNTAAPYRVPPAKRAPIERLEIDRVRIDHGIQARAHIDPETVEEYEAAMRAGARFPPAVVFQDAEGYWLADGFHRIRARKRAGFSDIEAEVLHGARSAAIWHSAGSNQCNGLRRTNADKQRAVALALEARPDESDRAIAEHCGVGPSMVTEARKMSSDRIGQTPSTARIGRDGIARRSSGTRAEQKAKREAIEKALRDDPTLTNPAVAEVVGCHGCMVAGVRKKLGIAPASKGGRRARKAAVLPPAQPEAGSSEHPVHAVPALHPQAGPAAVTPYERALILVLALPIEQQRELVAHLSRLLSGAA